MIEDKLRNKAGFTEEEFLNLYDAGKYDRPSVTVDTLVFTVTEAENGNYRKLPEKSLKILMIRRGDHPYMGQWALPGGFVNMDENLDTAAKRELKEETNIDNIYMEQLYTWGNVDRDPRTRVISSSYMALLDSTGLNVKADDDADDARWFTVYYKTCREQKTPIGKGYVLEKLERLELSNGEETLHAVIRVVKTVNGNVTEFERELVEAHGIAFDHAKIIGYAVERLRNKVMYTDMVFNLMPEAFTLTQLQKVYEVILDGKLLKAGFRRKIAGMVVKTGEVARDAGHRPSELFRFNPEWLQGKY